MRTRRSLISGAAALAAYQTLGARAQGIPGMAIPPGLIAGASPFALQYRAAYAGTNSVSSQTISSVDFGAADAARSILIVGGYWCSASQKSITGATIGGVTATILASGGGNGAFGLIASVPAGATGAVGFTMSGSDVQGLRFAVYRLANLQSQTPVTTSAIGAGASSGISRPNGAAIVYTGYQLAGGAASVTGLTTDDAASGHVEAHSPVNAGAGDTVTVSVSASAPYGDIYFVFK